MRTLSLLYGLTLLAGCASGKHAVSMNTAPTAFGAHGQVATSMNSAGNTRVKVSVRHLATPAKIVEHAEIFTVWARPDDGGPPVSLGTLKLDKDQNGTLKTVTPFRRFEIMITPERDAAADAPTHAPVLRGHVDAI